ncbi:TetR/AcrR family transcriptional regulator [Rhodococcus rhodnii]|uniref:TetR family transcriptional regulator n=1 Tax=Rhodococcus rhodnii LMG 5362 TaxID=1273125 RepID=R7WQV1_9NOCA|nr:TetR/AcrR family transcriptional regulator C-terminal domain-containing protein [Rhodococcus rhodnii]EOM77692.1 TetR family transcriptional regulator [Rhodococcus rhodnii LMG 5362]
MSENDENGHTNDGTERRAPTLGERFAALWRTDDDRTRTRRGRPARVSRRQIVDAGVAIADADGLDAVSMRSVAKSLGVGAMTLYSHVPGRAELVDAMIDAAYADFVAPEPDSPWREALEQYARGGWDLLTRHPWLLDVNAWRLPLGPHIFAFQEAGYRALVDTGLTGPQVVESIGIVDSMVQSLVRSSLAEAADSRDGIDYATYWNSTGEFWENTFEPHRFPSMTRLWAIGAFDTSAVPFQLRIGGLLDSLQLLVDDARARGGTRIPQVDECLAEMERPER